MIGTNPLTRSLNWAFMGAPSATRTRDLLLRRQLLYPLSYRGLPRCVLSDAVQRGRGLA
jgi:hypothetical protein